MFTLISFSAFTALVGLLSWLLTRKDTLDTSDGFFLGGRSLQWYFIGGSLLLTNLSAEQMVGLNGGAYQFGMVVMAWEVIAAPAMILMALFMLRHYLERGLITTPQLFEQRYDKQLYYAVTVITLIQMLFTVMPFILYTGATGLNVIFRVEELLGISKGEALWLMVVLIGIIGSIYALGGGLRAVAVSDTLNGAGLLIGGLLIPFLGLKALGDGNLADGLRAVAETRPEMLNPIGGPESNVPFSTLFTGMIWINVMYWCTAQYIVQRTFAARSLAQGQKGILFAAFMKLLGPLYLVLPGIIALQLFEGGLNHSDEAYPALVEAVLPPWLVGFFGAVLFGAVLSSFNSTLNSASTIFSVDIYNKFRQGAGDRESIRAGRIFGILAAIGAILIAPILANSGEGIFTLMKKIGAVFCAIPAIFLVGLFTKRPSALAAKIALVLGILLYSLFEYVWGNVYFGVQLSWLHSLAIATAIPTAFMLMHGYIWPRAGEELPHKPPESVDLTPWKWTLPVSIVILLAVILIYFSLWRFATG